MKQQGVVRAIDSLGRIVIPMEYRKRMNLKEGDQIEITPSGADLFLSPLDRHCVFCGAGIQGEVDKLLGKPVCGTCGKKLKEG